MLVQGVPDVPDKGTFVTVGYEIRKSALAKGKKRMAYGDCRAQNEALLCPGSI